MTALKSILLIRVTKMVTNSIIPSAVTNYSEETAHIKYLVTVLGMLNHSSLKSDPDGL